MRKSESTVIFAPAPSACTRKRQNPHASGDLAQTQSAPLCVRRSSADKGLRPQAAANRPRRRKADATSSIVSSALSPWKN
jgi:hypothetical protein